MFTGLIEEIGTVSRIRKGEKSAQITVQASKVTKDVRLGDSISTNGVCLTVTSFTNQSFTVDVMPETLRRSNLNDLTNGSLVNLERALQVGDRLGGHIVSGHIDGVGTIVDIEEEDNATWVSIQANNDILGYVVEKGSIAIDGTSLTVAYVDNKLLKVSIIPLTKEETTLLTKKIGDHVNLECDMIGKYVEKMLCNKKEEATGSNIDMEYLKKHGYA